MMNFMPHLGIIGLGVVGEAIRQHYEGCNLTLIDIDPNKAVFGTYQSIIDSEAIFVCVPSPQNLDGSCNPDILESVLKNLKDYKGVIISKVTAPPDVYEKLEKEYPNLVYVPEFLTASNAALDYDRQNIFVVGGQIPAYQREADRILRYRKEKAEVWFCDIGEAALIKYIVNTFLATKVVFMNEVEQISSKNGYDWNKIISFLKRETRIGSSHMQVPGPDGYKGFGGMCFPKDCSAFIHYSEKLGANLHVLKEAVKKNSLLRLTEPK